MTAATISDRFRSQRDKALRRQIERCANEGKIDILDLGGAEPYWRRVGVPFLRRHVRKLIVLNHAESELYAGAEDRDLFESAVGDACDLAAFRTASIGLVHSNSVIEHVGDWRRMQAFAAETRRVGRAYYAQTPNFWFPIDPHYYRAPLIHWMPRPWQAEILTAFPVCSVGRMSNISDAHEALDGTRLLDSTQMRLLFPEAALSHERLAGLSKSLIASHG